uniref:Uncharacterized protein n=1 Tax=Anopheles coluzzii TaxID=1518534 RepID=A0A8W7PTX5_ANOCL
LAHCCERPRVYDLQDGDITYLGNIMSTLAVRHTPREAGRAGVRVSVLEEAIVIAAGMNVKNIFCQLRTIEALRVKRHFANGSASDGIAILNAYNWWRSIKEQGTGGDTTDWCNRYMLDRKSLIEMAELVQEITMRLKTANIRVVSGANNARWTDRERTVVLKVVMAGAFYPNYFIPTCVTDRELSDKMVYTEIGGRDPFSTVFFCGFDHSNYIGPLYRNEIRALLTERKPTSEKHQVKVEFERSTNKIFVQFQYPPDQQSGKSLYEERNSADRVHPGVYEAIKLRQLRHNQSELLVMHHNDAVAYATEHRLGVWRNHEWHPRSVEIPNAHLSVEPPIHWNRVTATVTHVEHPNKFYLRPHDEKNDNIYHDIMEKLNGCDAVLRAFPEGYAFKQRDIVAAPLPNMVTGKMARAKLLQQCLVRGVEHWTVFFHGFRTDGRRVGEVLPPAAWHTAGHVHKVPGPSVSGIARGGATVRRPIAQGRLDGGNDQALPAARTRPAVRRGGVLGGEPRHDGGTAPQSGRSDRPDRQPGADQFAPRATVRGIVHVQDEPREAKACTVRDGTGPNVQDADTERHFRTATLPGG